MTTEGFLWNHAPKPGAESDWVEFCQLTLRGSKVHVADASYAADPKAGCMITMSPGVYCGAVKLMSFGAYSRVSRVRVVRPDVAAEFGPEIGKTCTDTARIGIYDFEVFARAWGSDNEASWEIISPAIESDDLHGVAELDASVGAVMPFVSSGFGDGEFPVHELHADGSRAGLEVIFIKPGEESPL